VTDGLREMRETKEKKKKKRGEDETFPPLLSGL